MKLLTRLLLVTVAIVMSGNGNEVSLAQRASIFGYEYNRWIELLNTRRDYSINIKEASQWRLVEQAFKDLDKRVKKEYAR